MSVSFGPDDDAAGKTQVATEVAHTIESIPASEIKPSEVKTDDGSKALREQEDEDEGGFGNKFTHLAELVDLKDKKPNLVEPHLYTTYPVAFAEFKKDLKARIPEFAEERMPKLFEKIFTLHVKRGIGLPLRHLQTDSYYYDTVQGRMHVAFRLDGFDARWAWLAGYQAHFLLMEPLNFFGSDK